MFKKLAERILNYIVQGFGYWFQKLIQPNFLLTDRDVCVLLSWMIFVLSFQASYVVASVTSGVWGYLLFAFIVFMLGVWRFWNYEVQDATIMAVILGFELVFPPFIFFELAWISVLSFIILMVIDKLRVPKE